MEGKDPPFLHLLAPPGPAFPPNEQEVIAYRQKWNVPDWRIAEAYPKLKDLSLALWRWEFLRRRADFRRDWEVLAFVTYQCAIREGSAGTGPASPDKDAVILDPDHPDFVTIPYRVDKYALAGLPNPAVRNPRMLSFLKPYGEMFFAEDDSDLGEPWDPTRDLPEGKVAVIFDLRISLRRQLKKIGEDLKTIQKQKYGSVKQRRLVNKRKSAFRSGDDGLWPLYLRVLDARNEKATFEEIGTCLFDLAVSEAYDQGKPRAQELYKAACQVSLNFPT